MQENAKIVPKNVEIQCQFPIRSRPTLLFRSYNQHKSQIFARPLLKERRKGTVHSRTPSLPTTQKQSRSFFHLPSTAMENLGTPARLYNSTHAVLGGEAGRNLLVKYMLAVPKCKPLESPVVSPQRPRHNLIARKICNKNNLRKDLANSLLIKKCGTRRNTPNPRSSFMGTQEILPKVFDRYVVQGTQKRNLAELLSVVASKTYNRSRCLQRIIPKMKTEIIPNKTTLESNKKIVVKAGLEDESGGEFNIADRVRKIIDIKIKRAVV